MPALPSPTIEQLNGWRLIAEAAPPTATIVVGHADLSQLMNGGDVVHALAASEALCDVFLVAVGALAPLLDEVDRLRAEVRDLRKETA